MATKGIKTAKFHMAPAPGEFTGSAKVYKVSPSVRYGANKQTQFIVSSATHAFFSGAETYIFPCDKSGKVLDWAELDGSMRGTMDNEAPLRAAGYKIIK